MHESDEDPSYGSIQRFSLPLSLAAAASLDALLAARRAHPTHPTESASTQRRALGDCSLIVKSRRAAHPTLPLLLQATDAAAVRSARRPADVRAGVPGMFPESQLLPNGSRSNTLAGPSAATKSMLLGGGLAYPLDPNGSEWVEALASKKTQEVSGRSKLLMQKI